MMVHDVAVVGGAGVAVQIELGMEEEAGQNIGNDFVYAWNIFDYVDYAVGVGGYTDAVAFEKDVIVVKEQKMRLEKT